MKFHLALIFTGGGLLVPVTALAKRDLNQGGTLLGQELSIVISIAGASDLAAEPKSSDPNGERQGDCDAPADYALANKVRRHAVK